MRSAVSPAGVEVKAVRNLRRGVDAAAGGGGAGLVEGSPVELGGCRVVIGGGCGELGRGVLGGQGGGDGVGLVGVGGDPGAAGEQVPVARSRGSSGWTTTRVLVGRDARVVRR